MMSAIRLQTLRQAGIGLLVGAAVMAGGKGRLPVKVGAAIKVAHPTARVTEVDRERKNGTVIYGVELQVADREIELKVDTEGVIGSVQEELKTADAPKAVAEACQKLYPGAKLDEIERTEIRGVRLFSGFALLKEPLVVYEVELKLADGGEIELVLDKAGKVLRRKTDDNDDDDDEHGDHDDDDD